MDFNTLRDFDFHEKTVLLKATLNVPVKDGKVTDTTRIDRLKPTIDYLVSKKAKVLILTYFGRPKGQYNDDFSVRFLPETLEKCWGVPVSFAESCVGEPAQTLKDKLNFGEIGLLENTRFHKEEEENDSNFAKRIATLGDIYVNDGFPDSHRSYVSTEGLAHYLPTAAGLLMEAELTALQDALEAPEKPVAAIVGGAKISTKLDVLGNLIKKVDMLVLGGGMANTFLAAQGVNTKDSLCEHDMLETARSILANAESRNCEIILPTDGLAAEKFETNAPHVTCNVDEIPDNHMMLDIGPQTIKMLESKLENTKTVLWNGPMGAFEIEPFDQGTNALAHFVAKKTKQNALKSIAGGGDTVAALEHAGCANDFSYISTAGGAFLEWLEGKTLPGVAALTAYQKNAA